MSAERPVFVRLAAIDNVVVALRDLSPGEQIAEAEGLRVREWIPRGHKLTTATIEAGAPVLKYGEVIGVATKRIEAGSHVHVHNVVSARLPGTEVTT